MVTVSLIALLVLALIATLGVIGYALNQGFFFWLFIGADAAEAMLKGVALIIVAIVDQNN